MRLKHLMVAGALAIVGLGGLLFQNNAMAVSCPEGSVNPDATTLAGCNIAAENSANNLFDTVNKIINVVLGVIGIVAVVVIIVGGVSYLTSQGDAGKVAKAKNTILYGVVGMMVALLAFAVVNFILTSVFSGSTGSGGKDDKKGGEENGLVLDLKDVEIG